VFGVDCATGDTFLQDQSSGLSCVPTINFQLFMNKFKIEFYEGKHVCGSARRFNVNQNQSVKRW